MRIGGTEQVQPSWFYEGNGRKVKKRKCIFHVSKSNPTFENERGLYLQRKVGKKMMKVAGEHKISMAYHNNPEEFFGYINKHTQRAPLGPVFSSDGHLVTDDKEIARALNIYFSNVFTVEDVDFIPDPAIVHSCETD